MWNNDNAIYDDGEWITWTEINSHLERLEFEARYPHLNVELGSCPAWWCSSAVVKLTGRALSSSAVAAGQVHGWPSKIFG